MSIPVNDDSAGSPAGLLAASLENREISRRDALKVIGAGALAASGAGAIQAVRTSTARAASGGSGSIKIGFVSPRTGAAAGFGEPDGYVLGLVRKAFGRALEIGGTRYTVEVIDEDSQSGPRSAQAANNLINGDGVDLILTTSTPETVNPVSDTAEAAGVPCISTVVPWEAWYFGRQANPAKPVPFKYTFHFCFGVAQFFNAYTHLWPQVPTNKTVGVMWPNDADGNAIRASLGPMLKKAGYTIVDPGAYADGTNDYSAQISKFKSENCEIFNTFPIPPDFATFWRQAVQQGYKPKIAQIAKTGLFPSQVDSLGSIGANLGGGVYWAPTWPYRSSFTGITSKALGARLRAVFEQAVESAAWAQPGPLRRRRGRVDAQRQPERQSQAGGSYRPRCRGHSDRPPGLG